MPDVTRQLERLRSANRNTRYGACEELRVAATIPEEAIAALRHACNDLDLCVLAVLLMYCPGTAAP